MAQNGDDKLTEAQENFIKNLLKRCKTEHDETWSMPEMVGFYSEASLPVAQVRSTADALSIKKLVCSPDFPISEFPGKPLDQESFHCHICNKISSDKENFKDSPMPMVKEPIPASYDSDIHYYLYTRERLSPTCPTNYSTVPTTGVELLAAAASVTEDDKFRSAPNVVFNLIKNPQEVVAALTHPAYFTSPTVQYTALNAADDIRRRVEAALAVEENHSEEEPIITPPSSNPVSPAPSVSPPVSPAPDPELSLPPRKRSKMILKSMEASIDLSPVRYNSVIHYARAS
ncbi:hypothetical protein NQ315_015708 [Exocentrus adspersus]|uniref:Uncharacterized protein n=1 Tax=Exocentrus adspersus TaxID=1586481 RepID=A0AAV8W4C1_9CUCU|nr:hypothetical protein NQ315_015708 [Exocentrus adspersus]